MEKYIDSAVEQFRTLITEQLARQNLSLIHISEPTRP